MSSNRELGQLLLHLLHYLTLITKIRISYMTVLTINRLSFFKIYNLILSSKLSLKYTLINLKFIIRFARRWDSLAIRGILLHRENFGVKPLSGFWGK